MLKLNKNTKYFSLFLNSFVFSYRCSKIQEGNKDKVVNVSSGDGRFVLRRVDKGLVADFLSTNTSAAIKTKQSCCLQIRRQQSQIASWESNTLNDGKD